MVFAYRGEDFETDLRHECTHALLNAALPVVPLWLDEGLAEYFEVLPQSAIARKPASSERGVGRPAWENSPASRSWKLCAT
jgi:hypothetical protein